MVEVRASRLAAEVVAAEGSYAAVTRVGVQVASSSDSPVEVQASRLAFEVVAAEGSFAAVSRLGVQVASSPDSPVEVQASRLAFEVVASPDLQAGVTRMGVQVAGQFDATVGVRCSRMAIEAVARQGSAGPVTPLALSDDAHIFLHNWVQKGSITTAFNTSIAASPSTGAEARRGLTVKPTRTMELQWFLCKDEPIEEIERLEVLLRRLTNTRFQVPIYPDQQELSAAYLSTETSIAVTTNRGRFFPGARVVIVQIDHAFQVSSFSFHTISSMTNSSLTFSSQLGVNVAAGSLVFPVMDCEVLLEAEAEYLTARRPRVRMTVIEAPGASQLPPLKSDTPTGASAYDGRPVWFEEPDWSNGITKGRSRQGSRSESGRASFVSLEASRSRQTHKYAIAGTRATMWNALEFFETRRGRLRSFWHIDQDQYMEAVNIDASGTFIGVSEIGSLADFQEEFTHVGIVMTDGTVFVRQATTIQQILTVFRITMDSAITLGYTAADVARVARARLTRFESDTFTETWENANYMATAVSFIETLDENNYSTT